MTSLTTTEALAAHAHTPVRLRQVFKSYGSTPVLRGIDLDIAGGEFLSLLGPSGCGKTTLLRLLAGLETLTGGSIEIGARTVADVPTHRRDIGMVFQAYSLFPHLTVLRNTAFGLNMRRVAAQEAEARAAEALELVGLSELAGRYPHQLSGGQQQRVALARALVTRPRVLLLDEPLSALDAKVRVSLREEIRRIQRELGITTVFVTHDQEEALAISDRVAVMDSGRIAQIGTPEELYRQPASPEVAAFVGQSTRVPVTVWGGYVTIAGTALPVAGDTPDGPGIAYLRPEHVSLVSDGGTEVTVQDSVFLGSQRRTTVVTDDDVALVVQHDTELNPRPGERARIQVQEHPVVVAPVQ